MNRLVKIGLIFSLQIFALSAFAIEWETPGSYSVPVPPDLQSFASYPLSGVCFFQDGDQVAVGYNLPAELTGRTDSDIVLKGTMGPDGVAQAIGEHATAVCTKDLGTNTVSCDVHYFDLAMDYDNRLATLVKEFPNPTDLNGRIKVASIFSGEGEPHGIVTFANTPKTGTIR
jgi:hypothetical protein